MEEKKPYETPAIEVVEIQWEAPLLMQSQGNAGPKYYHYELE